MNRLTIDHSESLLHHVRQMGASMHDFPAAIASRTVDSAVDKPIAALGHGPDGAVFWLGADGAAVVDARVFGPLTTAFVTRLPTGESVMVGKASVPDAMKPLDRITLLLRAGIILTYSHIGSELCMAPDSTGQRFHFTGSHTYFTQTENRDPLDFSVRITNDGAIVVRGE